MSKRKSSPYIDELKKDIKQYGIVVTMWHRFQLYCIVEHPVISQVLIPALVAMITTLVVKKLVGL